MKHDEYYIVADRLYVTVKYLIRIGIPKSTIYNSIDKNKKKGFRDWITIDHPSSDKQILIDYETIVLKNRVFKPIAQLMEEIKMKLLLLPGHFSKEV